MMEKESLEREIRGSFEKALRDILRKQDPEVKKMRVELREAQRGIRTLTKENKNLRTKMDAYDLKRVKDVRGDKEFLERIIEEMIFNRELPVLEGLIEKKKTQWSAAVKEFA